MLRFDLLHARPLRSAACVTLLACLGVAAVLLSAESATAQPQSRRERIEQNRRRGERQRQQAQQDASSSDENANGKKKEQGKQGDEQNGEGDDSDATPSVTRSDKPPREPDPRELQIEPVNGRVQFDFHGQPWPDVLQWLANASKLSLDWQELPAGYLNLTTQRAYTLAEARDLINRHLQARGYVLLLSGEVMSVTKIDKLDPSLVPRATEDELYDRLPHDFVKVTFQLPEAMDVKQTSEDIKQTLSKHAKIVPLATTKRLLLIDAVGNLRLVSALLNEERLELEGRVIPRRFPLKHARAERVINTLYVVLGLDPSSQPSQMELQLQQKKLDLLKQMQQRGKDVAKLLNRDGPPVYLAFNRHDNSILANAPPEQLEVIDRTIKMLDIPPPGMAMKEGIGAGERYAKTYELESIEPDALISSLEEIGNLDPLTDLRGDKKSKVLFARATESDHERIEQIIEQLDGPKFRVEVYDLRRHPADEVAGTLMALVGGQEEKKEQPRRRSYFYFGYDRDEDDEETVELRVEADIENNRIFVRGNDAQQSEVRAFLVQIGELPGKQQTGYAGRPVRVFESVNREATDRLLEQLRASWPALGAGELRINDARPDPEPDPEPDDEAQQEEQPAAESQPLENRTTRAEPRPRFRFASDSVSAGGQPANTPGAAINITEDGRIVISSDDPELLARLERLVETLMPEEETFTEFRLQHVSARYVQTKLEDFYEEILNAGVERKYTVWGEYQGKDRKEVGSRLSRRRRLRMVYNVVTNSIVVTNASPAQLREIKRLIDIWDQPPMEDVIFQRRTGMVKVRYSRATAIAAALKDVYRDLLSARDKEFDTEEAKGGGFATEKLTQIEYSGAETNDPTGLTPTRKTKAIETTFDGTLSIGVDELANMIVISADSQLYASVVDMIQKLDEQARPKTAVQVVRVGVPAESLRETLDEVLGNPWAGGRPERRGAGGRQQGEQQNNGEQRGRESQRQQRPQRRGR